MPRQRIEPHFGKAGGTARRGSSPTTTGAESPPRARASRAPGQAARRAADGYHAAVAQSADAPRAGERTTLSAEVIRENATALEGVLADFGVRGEIINARPGPVVTLYELEPAPGIKSSRVISLADDIARSMSALSARVAVVSGRNAIGIELPNPTREKVYLRELLASRDYAETAARLPLCLGKAIGGEAGAGRSRPHAASAHRRHHRLGQVGRHQHHDPEPGLPAASRPVPADHGRSENARALRL